MRVLPIAPRATLTFFLCLLGTSLSSQAEIIGRYKHIDVIQQRTTCIGHTTGVDLNYRDGNFSDSHAKGTAVSEIQMALAVARAAVGDYCERLDIGSYNTKKSAPTNMFFDVTSNDMTVANGRLNIPDGSMVWFSILQPRDFEFSSGVKLSSRGDGSENLSPCLSNYFEVSDPNQGPVPKYHEALESDILSHAYKFLSGCKATRTFDGYQRKIEYQLFNNSKSLSLAADVIVTEVAVDRSKLTLKISDKKIEHLPNGAAKSNRPAVLIVSDKVMDHEREERRKARAEGRAYRNIFSRNVHVFSGSSAEWARFGDLPAAVYFGRYKSSTSIPLDDIIVRASLQAYTYQKDALCPKSFSPTDPTVVWTTTKTHTDYLGNDTVIESEEYVRIEKRFEQVYMEAQERSRRGAVGALLSGDILSSGISIFELNQQFRGVYADVISRGGCSSATLEQFAQNTLRYATGRKSIQRAKIDAGPSDELPTVADANTFSKRCTLWHEFSNDSFAYCTCLEKDLVPALSSQDARAVDVDWAKGMESLYLKRLSSPDIAYHKLLRSITRTCEGSDYLQDPGEPD